MTFSEFAQMLFPYIGEGMSSADYIVFLTSRIMDKTFLDKDSENHPFGKKKDDTLARIYNGKRTLSQKDAKVILCHLDKTRFIEYLAVLPVDTLDLIRNAFSKSGITIDENEIDTCANLFVSILEGHAQNEGTANKKTASSPKGSTELQINSLHMEMIKIFKEIAEYCHITDFIDKEPSYINFRIRETDCNYLSLATRFVKDIQSEIFILFDSYKSEMIYIKISQFVSLVTKYEEYLKRELPHHGFPNNISKGSLGIKSPFINDFQLNSKSDFELETERYQAKLKSLYEEICKADIN